MLRAHGRVLPAAVHRADAKERIAVHGFDVLVVFKRPVVERDVIRPVVAVTERDADVPGSVALGAGHKRAPRRHGVAGLDADASVVHPQQLVVVINVLPGHDGVAGRHDARKVFVGHAVRGQDGHVPGRGVVPLSVEAMRVFKVGAGHAQLSRLLVHEPRKVLHAACRVYGQRQSGVVSGHEHESVKQVFDRVALACFEVHGRAFRAHAAAVCFHFLAQGAVFQHDDGGHDFRRAGDQHTVVGIVLVEHLAGVRVYQYRRVRSGRRCGQRRGRQNRRGKHRGKGSFQNSTTHSLRVVLVSAVWPEVM